MANETMCDSDGCEQVAVYRYRYDWGTEGVCCTLHRRVVEQSATQTGRGVTWQLVNPGYTPPLERDERVQLKQAIVALEDETAALRTKLSQSLEHSQRQGQMIADLRVKLADAERSVAELRDNLDRALAERDEYRQRVGELSERVDAFALERPTVVEAEAEATGTVVE